MRRRIVRTEEDRAVFNRVGGKSHPALDECRDVLLDRDCNEPVITKPDVISGIAYRQSRLRHLLEYKRKFELLPEAERQMLTDFSVWEKIRMVFLTPEERIPILALSKDERRKVSDEVKLTWED